jgi:hypothetical protein
MKYRKDGETRIELLDFFIGFEIDVREEVYTPLYLEEVL